MACPSFLSECARPLDAPPTANRSCHFRNSDLKFPLSFLRTFIELERYVTVIHLHLRGCYARTYEVIDVGGEQS